MADDLYTPLDEQPWASERFLRQSPTWAPSGVIGVPQSAYGSGAMGLSFAVAGSVITVQMAPGRANCRGVLYERVNTSWTSGATGATPTPGSAPYAPNSSSNPRIDRLVLRRDAAAKKVYPLIIQGTPGGTPTKPALTQSETGVWDTPLFSWQLAGSPSTTISNIVDERDWVDPDGHGGGAAPATQALTLQNGWSTPAGHGQQAYFDGTGLACCTGWVQNDVGIASAAAQIPVLIPAQYWPAQSHFFSMPIFDGAGSYIPPALIEVNNSGQVIVRRLAGAVPTPCYWDLSCIRYHPQSTA